MSKPVQTQQVGLDGEDGVFGLGVHGQVDALEPDAKHDREFFGFRVPCRIEMVEQVAEVEVRGNDHIGAARATVVFGLVVVHGRAS